MKAPRRADEEYDEDDASDDTSQARACARARRAQRPSVVSRHRVRTRREWPLLLVLDSARYAEPGAPTWDDAIRAEITRDIAARRRALDPYAEPAGSAQGTPAASPGAARASRD